LNGFTKTARSERAFLEELTII